jgi:hypothetical protein
VGALGGGTLSGWLWEVLEPHVEKLEVAGVRESRGPKSDKRDAFALAEQLRIGALETVVYKDRGRLRWLGQLARAYGFVTRDTVRVKNRLKSVYRSRGVWPGKGRSVYGKGEREGIGHRKGLRWREARWVGEGRRVTSVRGEGEDSHLAAARGTHERQHVVDAREQDGAADPPGGGWSRGAVRGLLDRSRSWPCTHRAGR